MSRSRPASSPLSFHKPTGQFYVTRNRKRVYLGADPDEALDKYHRLALGLVPVEQPRSPVLLTAKELANRFLTAQQANWRNPNTTFRGYREWLGRFLADHPGLRAEDLTMERFASWKLSLRRRGYSVESINHYLSAVRAMYRFGEDSGLLTSTPLLARVKNEPRQPAGSKGRPLYSPAEIRRLLENADVQLRLILLLGLNCGFGPKDVQDLSWSDIEADRVTLPRSKTGVCQTYQLWPETLHAMEQIKHHREELIGRLARRSRQRSDNGRVFITKFWRPWNKDAVAEQFRKLCTKAKVPCHGFYRLRHCASTAMSLVATPHVQRKFMRHTQLQQQVTYTHIPDQEVDEAVMRARVKLLPESSEDSESGPKQADIA